MSRPRLSQRQASDSSGNKHVQTRLHACLPACLPACLSVCEGTNISHISLSGISRYSKATIGNQVCGHRHSKSYLSGEQTTRTYVERKEITKKNNLDNDLVDYPKPKKKKKKKKNFFKVGSSKNITGRNLILITLSSLTGSDMSICLLVFGRNQSLTIPAVGSEGNHGRKICLQLLPVGNYKLRESWPSSSIRA